MPASRPLRLGRRLLIACLAALALGGCSVSQYLTAERPLYAGTELEIVNPERVPDPDKLETRLLSLVEQEESGKVGMWWWFKLATPKEKGIKHWLRNTLGAEPEYYSEEAAQRAKLLMRDYLKDHGFFGAELALDTARLDSVHVANRFALESAGRSRVDTVVWPEDPDSDIDSFFQVVRPGRYVTEGSYYAVSALDAERARLDQLSARRGYFEFAKNNVYYIVDSTAGDDAVRVYMRLDRGRDSLAFSRFYIGETYVYPDYDRTADYSDALTDTTYVDGVAVIRHGGERLHAGVIVRRLGLRRGDLYDVKIYENTVNQLLDLGVFKYVNYEFRRRLTDSFPVLDQYVYLTQGQSQSASVDLEATTRPGSLFGLGATVGHTNNNLFNGAEDLRVSVNYAFGPQTSIVDADSTIIAQEYGGEVELALPRLVAPFARELERKAFYIPRTIASLRYQLLSRPDFDLQNVGLRFGYRYRANRYVTHELYPVNVNYTGLIDPSASFLETLASNARLSRSFADNAILGLEYRYRYSDQAVTGSRDFWAIESGVKTSGNVASLLASPGDAPGDPKQVGGVALSQFFRAFGDVSRTWLFGGTSFATRAYAGAAIPYGDSEVVPFVEQFFGGGPNSVRAFRLRDLGPGRVAPARDAGGRRIDLNQTGDIRLELNGEYRVDLGSFFETAVFVDAGNVWLYNDVGELAPEGVFDVRDFYRELAVGVGTGLRIDLDFLLLRADIAAPVRRPWVTDNGGWDFGTLNLFSGSTFRDDWQLHIAIGYPF